jgi:hypothetical protein
MDPRFPVVLAFYARDTGDAESARALVETSLSIEERPEIRRLLDVPVAEWPATLRDVTGENRKPRGEGGRTRFGGSWRRVPSPPP